MVALTSAGAVKCGRATFILWEDYERYLQSLPPIIPDTSDSTDTARKKKVTGQS
jgi:hypothetical protein